MMHAASTSAPGSGPEFSQNRQIGVRLTPRSLAPHAESALRALGYSLREDVQPALDEPDLWIVDSDRLDEIPDESAAPGLRMLLVASPQDFRFEDPRVLDCIKRPGRLSSIYSMVQLALEDTPRATPRVDTRLSARCIRDDRRSIGAVLSLSEGGCFLNTPEDLRRGMRLDLQFALPDYGLVSTEAECRYTKNDGAGLAFKSPASDVRHSIAHFIQKQLATLQLELSRPATA